MENNTIYEEGHQYQDYISDRLFEQQGLVLQYTTSKVRQYHSETRQGIEIKYDKLFASTGNLYLVFKMKNKAGVWQNTGFLKDDNTWLIIIGDYNQCFYFFKDSLKELKRLLLAGGIDNSNIRISGNDRSEALIIPINDPLMKIYCGKRVIFK